MAKLFWPTWFFDDIYKIPEGFFEKKNIRYLLCDIDNTLVTYDDPVPTPSVLQFFERLKKEQVSLIFVSNNEEERVKLFSDNSPFPSISKAGKPKKTAAKKAMALISANREQTAVLGDQILTDTLFANRSHLRMILVRPIKDKKTWFFRLKRSIEKPIIRSYLKKNTLNSTKEAVQ